METALNRAASQSENSGNRVVLGVLAHRKGGYLTKKRHHRAAVHSFLQALESCLITGNFYGVQSACGEIGSGLHRLDLETMIELN